VITNAQHPLSAAQQTLQIREVLHAQLQNCHWVLLSNISRMKCCVLGSSGSLESRYNLNGSQLESNSLYRPIHRYTLSLILESLD